MMSSLKYLLILLLIVNITRSEDEYPKVKTPLGVIRGYYKTSRNGTRYEAYEGIPYALPPTGKLRFEEPQPMIPWSDELSAITLSPKCKQYVGFPTGVEDCLQLNLYVPVREKEEPLFPVLIMIHGGGFMRGSGMKYGPTFLMDKKVVFINLNYRLGPLGFLSTEDEVVPGNMGLKDQSTALKWVAENVESFGGDPKKVTLVGLSAGGASVHFHYMSPLSAGLFQNGISLSGTALNCWTQSENPLEKALKLGAIVGCPTNDTREMVECMKEKPADMLLERMDEFMPWLSNPFTPFGPVIEKAGCSPFIDRQPIDLINSGYIQDLPWITGVVTEEGLYPVSAFATNESSLKDLNDKWEWIGPHLLDFNFTLPKDNHTNTVMKIREHYFGNKPIDSENVHSLTVMVGDRLFSVDAAKAARLQAKVNKSPVWFYLFSYRGAHSFSDYMSNTTENLGVCHGDDVFFVTDSPFFDPTTTAEDRHMTDDLLNFWVSIATNSTPDFGHDVHWSTVTPHEETLNYLEISGPGSFTMRNTNNFSNESFWNAIDFNENKI